MLAKSRRGSFQIYIVSRAQQDWVERGEPRDGSQEQEPKNNREKAVADLAFLMCL
jgi:hypothetical protein